jgi:hypothetical protein
VLKKLLLNKLKQKQNASGGFPWFGGNEENEYITSWAYSRLGIW